MGLKKWLKGLRDQSNTESLFQELMTRNLLSRDSVAGIAIETLQVMETLKNYKKSATILIDIGAHRGFFTKAANAFFKFDHTICFEPNGAFLAHIAENNLDHDIDIENIALDSRAGVTTYYHHVDRSMNSLVEADVTILKDEFPHDDPSYITSSIVHTTTLDEYMESKKWIDSTFIVKLDTQGNELNILEGGIKTLAHTEVCIVEHIFTTPYYSSYSFYDLIVFMQAQHFKCMGPVTIKKRPSFKISAVDFIFVRME